MCDFSKYGVPSEEWLTLEPHLPPAPLEDAASHRARERLAAQEFALLADRLVTRDYTIPTRDGGKIQTRTYQLRETAGKKDLPVYMHLHGGGFFFGTLTSEDGICAGIAAGTGAVVFNVNYRHTDTHSYPTAHLDVQDAFAWLHANIGGVIGGDPQKVVVGGISAGGNLSASLVVAQHLRTPGSETIADLPRPSGQVILIPVLVMPKFRAAVEAQIADPETKASFVQCRDAPVLPKKRADFYIAKLKIENADPEDYMLNPGLIPTEKAKGLPPATFGVAGMDPLRDEAILYAKKLAEAGVPTNVNVFPGLPHDFRRFGDKLPHSSKVWDGVMHAGIKWALSNPQPTPFKIKEH